MNLIMVFSEAAEDWFYIMQEYRPNFGDCYWFTGDRSKALNEEHLTTLKTKYPKMKFKLVQSC